MVSTTILNTAKNQYIEAVNTRWKTVVCEFNYATPNSITAGVLAMQGDVQRGMTPLLAKMIKILVIDNTTLV